MGKDFGGILNQSTPFAPTNEEEISKRLETENTGHTESSPSASGSDATSQSSMGSGDAVPTGLSRVYVPTVRPVRTGDSPEYQLRVMEDGTAGIAVYTSVDRLRGCLGGDQPWSEVSLLELLYLVGKNRIGVALNPRIDADLTPERKPRSRTD